MHSRVAVSPTIRPTIANHSRVIKIAPREFKQSPIADFGFETYVSYRNGFPYPVVLTVRNGLAVTIPAVDEKWRVGTEFLATVRYRFAKDVKIDSHRILDAVPETSTDEIIALRDAILEARVNITQNGHECLMQYAITREQFEKSGGALYVESLDITLSSNDPNRPIYHPYSARGKLIAGYDDDPGFGYRIIINDLDGEHGDRWANIAGRAYRIHASCDFTKRPGVYIQLNGHVENGELEEIYHEFGSAEAASMLFRTADEARTLGNVAEERKREYEASQHQQRMQSLDVEILHKQKIQSLELELAKQKHQKGEREHELGNEVARLKRIEYQLEEEAKVRESRYAKEKEDRDVRYAQEKEERERRSYADKDYYERRSYDRKDSSEIVKWIPPIVVGVGLILSKFL